MSNITRIESLSKDNYETWKMQMEAVLIKNDLWQYVSGELIKPENTTAAPNLDGEWKKSDKKAKSDIILCVSPSELTQLKGCNTSREVWLKLENIYASKGPARKATLLKQLTLKKMPENEDVRSHLRKFFETVDKLSSMNVDINEDLLSIMLLYSLPESFENFRCAIETRDILPRAEDLKIKILEESDARTQKGNASSAMVVINKDKYDDKKNTMTFKNSKECTEQRNVSRKNFNIKCYRCHRRGHIAAKCRVKLLNDDSKKRKQYETQNVEELDEDDVFFAFTGNIDYDDTNRDYDNEEWILDSGCTSHLCNHNSAFRSMSTIDKIVNLANNQSTNVKGKGTVELKIDKNGQEKMIKLENALYVPDLRSNLMSIAKIVDKGNYVTFYKNIAIVRNNITKKVCLIADRIGNLYYLKKYEEVVAQYIKDRPIKDSLLKLWHNRMGHLNEKSLRKIMKESCNMNFKTDESISNCDACAMGKQTIIPFSHTGERSKNLLDIVHSDVCGPFSMSTIGGARYFVTFIDNCSRWCMIYLLKNKDEVIDKFVQYKNFVENFTGMKIKHLQTDNGKEYCNNKFDQVLKDNGILRRLSAPYTPQQNGLAERKNRTLIEATRCMIIQSGMKSSFWGEALMTANYIRNRCPTIALDGKTPYEAWNQRVPSLQHMKTFGCKVYVLKKLQKSKLCERSVEGRFVGYAEEAKAYRIWVAELKKIIISRDVKFINEGLTMKVASKENNTNVLKELDIDLTEQVNEERDITNNDNENATEVRRLPGRPSIVRTGKPGRPRKTYRSTIESENLSNEVAVNQDADTLEDDVFREEEVNHIEVSLDEALSSEFHEEWNIAICEEFKQIIKNDTWDIVEKPKHCNIIDSKLVLSNKTDATGKIVLRKARLVARGFRQIYGLDYCSTFAPVARLESLRILIALAVQLDLKIDQLDVKNAFLNGKLDKKVYMKLPDLTAQFLNNIVKNENDKNIKIKVQNMIDKIKKGNQVCLLKKALYGLKQASRVWNAKIDSIFKSLNLKVSQAEPCLYYNIGTNGIIIIILYVDDILIAYNNVERLNEIKNKLKREVEVKDLGEAKYCVGIEIVKKNDKIFLLQRKHIDEIIEKYNMIDAKISETPADASVMYTLKKGGNDKFDLPFRELIGSLTYLSVATRPDIMHSVVFLSQFNTCFSDEHWNVAKRIVRYLKHTKNYGLMYSKSDTSITGYVDADWGSNVIDRKSFTGYIFKFGACTIVWKSVKQKIVAQSSAEAEYVAMAESTKEILFLKNLLSELNIVSNIVLYNDNQSAKLLASDNVYHQRSKHIDLKYHFLRDCISKQMFNIKYLSTQQMFADVMTKPLNRSKHYYCIEGMDLLECV